MRLQVYSLFIYFSLTLSLNAIEADYLRNSIEFSQNTLDYLDSLTYINQRRCREVQDTSSIDLNMLCELGLPRKTKRERELAVSNYCNSSFRDSNYELLLNKRSERSLIDSLDIDLDIGVIVNDTEIYPSIFYDFLDQSPCYFRLRKERCMNNIQEELLTDTTEQQSYLNQIFLIYESLPEPKIESCISRIDNDKQSKVQDFCQWIDIELGKRKDFFDNFYSQSKVERLNELLQQVTYDTAAAITNPSTRIALSKNLSKVRGVVVPDMAWLENQRYDMNASAKIPSYTIEMSPYFMSFLDVPNGEDYLYLILAHELFHLMTLDEESELKTDFYDQFLCLRSQYEGNADNKDIPDFARECTADYFTYSAMASANSFSTHEDKALFITRSSRFLCSIHTSSISATESHPEAYDRIYLMFRNNSLRESIGCEPVPEEHQCSY